MYDTPARVERLSLPEGRRILVISDIHGNLPYFKGLLSKLDFGDADELIIDGDFLEKGAESLETLRYIMELSRAGNVHTVCGNCDHWSDIFDDDIRDERLIGYMLWKQSGLLWDMCNAAGFDPLQLEDFSACKARLAREFSAEWRFLSALPCALESENFIFAHAAADPSKPLAEHSIDELMRCDRFMDRRSHFKKWLIVGHYPVVLYGDRIVCANPIIDRECRVISIDGGCVLKDDGQLNALIIPDKNSDSFSFMSYDSFPLYEVLQDQTGGGRSYYIRWGDSTVQVLERGAEFSRCRHVRTGYEMDILTKYLFTGEEYTDCNDCTDYVLPLKQGDIVSLIEKTSRGYFVKHRGYSGWYFGKLCDTESI